MSNWDRFDFKAVSLFTGTPERNADCKREMDRVGIVPSPFWSAPDPYDHFIEARICHSRMCHDAYLSITLKHLRMVKTAYELGAEHALFLENDVRFLKDTEKLEWAVWSLPSNYDVALFDWCFRNKATEEEVRGITAAAQDGQTWVPFTDLRSCACYALSRRGMLRFIIALEAPALGRGKLKICDQHWFDVLKDGTLKGYCACPCACVQGVPGGATDYEHMWARYARAGIRREDYAE